MSRLKRNIVSILMVVSMSFALFGCSSSGDNNSIRDKEKFVGTWETTVDMTDYANKLLQQGIDQDSTNITEYINIDKYEVTLLYTFNDNETYSISADKDRLKQSFEAIKSDFKNGAIAYFEDILAANGIDKSVDEMLELSGVSLDDYINETFGDDMFRSMVVDMKSTGEWQVDGGLLYLTYDDMDENECLSYEFTSDGIKLSDINGEDWYGMYPMILKKVE